MTQEQRSEAARLLAAARPRGIIACLICGTTFEGYTSGKRPGKYCSPRCQRKGYRVTHAEEERARKRRYRHRTQPAAAAEGSDQ